MSTLLSFSSLPRETRLHVLTFTHLIRQDDWTWDTGSAGPGVTIYRGKFSVPRFRREEGRSCPFPRELFLVSKQMNEDASDVFFGMQRFTIARELEKGRRWLENLRERDARRIRTLDIELEPRAFWALARNTDPAAWPKTSSMFMRPYEWPKLIDAIVRRCEVEKMWLSVNAGTWLLSEDLVTMYQYEEFAAEDGQGHPHLKRAFWRMAKTLAQGLKKGDAGGPKRFYFFLCWAIGEEHVVEREVMGPEYDSTRDGKLPCASRDSWCPHWRVLTNEERWENEERGGDQERAAADRVEVETGQSNECQWAQADFSSGLEDVSMGERPDWIDSTIEPW